MQKIAKSIGPFKKPSTGFFKDNRQRLLATVQQNMKITDGDIALLKGPVIVPNFDDDAAYWIPPENLYYYLMGIQEPDTYAVFDLKTAKVTVFVPKEEPAKSYWKKIKNAEDYKKEFEIDDALYLDELPAFLKKTVDPNKNLIYVNKGKSPYSNLESLNPKEDLKEILSQFKVDEEDFYEVACESRVFKSKDELALIQQAVDLGIYVHKEIMRVCNTVGTETGVSNRFYSIAKQYGSELAYSNIVAAGKNASILHYIPTGEVTFQPNDMLLIDSGCRLYGYCSDITRSYPISGVYSQKQKDIYNAVLTAQKLVLESVRPQVSWQDMHILAERTILFELKKLGLIQGDLHEMWEKRVIYYFMPHGLGHYIGLYVHDLPGLRKKEQHFNPIPKMNLRVKRILEEGMVLTCEPGIYFNQMLLDSAYNDPVLAPFFVKDVIESYQKELGGVRIEDMFVVTSDGADVLTKDLPKTVEDVEAFIAASRKNQTD